MVNKNSLLSQLQDLDITNKNRRGFTDHEHLNEQQLIHMNGRVYDYNLGRFMSVDPFIQSPTSTQSINPYSYIMNNPLAGTDPTGYCSTKDSVAGCSDSLGEGESSDITEGGKVVGTVGKDSQGNMYITKSNGNAGHQAIQGAMGKAGDVSKVGSLEGNAAKGSGGNQSHIEVTGSSESSKLTNSSTCSGQA